MPLNPSKKRNSYNWKINYPFKIFLLCKTNKNPESGRVTQCNPNPSRPAFQVGANFFRYGSGSGRVDSNCLEVGPILG